MRVLELIWAGLEQGLAMVWATLWALGLGFLLSGAIQSFVSRREMRSLLGDRSPLSLLRATGFGAASSSCSYAASAMAKSIFAKGADFVAAMVFMFASTNLVIELGIVLAVLIGWQFTASEFLGGLLMIALFVLVARVAIPDSLVEQARARLTQGGVDATAGSDPACAVGVNADTTEPAKPDTPWRDRLRSRQAWSDAAGYAAADLTMLKKELAIGFLVAGFLSALVPTAFWQAIFISGHGFLSSLENAAIGPFIAMISFVCSVGNVPLAAALWKGGISFGGVVSFIFADLLSFPLLLIYRKFYGTRLTLRMLGSFWLVMSTAGLVTEVVFSWFHILPTTRPTVIVSNAFAWNYTTWLDIVALVLLAAAFWESHRRRVSNEQGQFTTDPVCGMQVDIAMAPATATFAGRRYYFCSDRCKERFIADPTHFFASGPVGMTQPEPATALDPVCGMTVKPENAAASMATDGKTYYFCSLGCRDRFAADPHPFLASGPVGMAQPEPATALDPVCGMTVKPENAAASMATDGKTYYCCSLG
ncbi:MAG: permease, partial [Candidatus Dormibacteria bacterium]